MESDSDDSICSYEEWYEFIQYLPEWNPLTRIEDYLDDLESGGNPWKIIQEEEFQKIASFSTGELFSHINHVERTDYRMISRHHSVFYGFYGPDVANDYEKTLISIVMKLKNRLEEELQISDDIQNVREVLTGNISISDHTALSCVFKRMRNTARASKIRRYIDKMAYVIESFEALFRFHHWRLEQEEMERLEARRSRKRRAPERLNIASTKKKSYF